VPSVLRIGRVVVCGTYDGEMVAVDSTSLSVVHRSQPHEGSIKAMARLQGDEFVSCATDRVVAAGGLADRTPLWEHGNLVNSVATLDSSVVASASRDHTVKIGWARPDRRGRWEAGACTTLLGPDESVKCVGLLGTAADPVVLAGSYDFGLYSWQMSRGSPATGVRSGAVVAEFGQAVSCICRIDPLTAAVAGWDGRIAIVRLQGGPVRVIANLSVADLISHAGCWS
jgi:toxoflavin biosynthesis protein ToxC